MRLALKDITMQNVWSVICWSADGLDETALVTELSRMARRGVDLSQLTVKIDAAAVEEFGPSILSAVIATGVRVFYDGKFIEIPEKLERRARIACGYRPYMINCMAHALSSQIWQVDDPNDKKQRDQLDGLKRFALVCEDAGVRSCAVTVLTSKQPGVVEAEYNNATTIQQVVFYAEQLLAAGFTDMVCSTHEAEIIREDPRFDSLRLWCPGIRPAGANVQDQARTGTPEWGIEIGVDVLVIGRPITEGEEGSDSYMDPAANIVKIAENLVTAADEARAAIA